MPITDRQRELRRLTIGSSDSPAICGLSPFASAHDVWEDKVFGVSKWDDDGPLPTHIEAGNYLEPAALAWFSDKTGMKLRRNVNRRLKGEHFSANLDGVAIDPVRGWSLVVEAKVASTRFWSQMAEREGRDDLEWGEDGSDAVPSPVLLQVQHQMLVTGIREARVVAALVDRTVEFRQYIVARDEALIALIISAGNRFWDCVETRTPPDPTHPLSLRVLSSMHRHDTPVQLGEDAAAVVNLWMADRAKANLTKAIEKEMRAKAVTLLGDAEEGILPDGRRFTFREITRRGVDANALRAARPDIAAEYETTTRYRQARVTLAAPAAITSDPLPYQLVEG